jgi:hypothetical protein
MIGLSLWQKGTELLGDGLDEVRLECGHGGTLLCIGKLQTLPE